jgi:hypothetical protein
MKMKQLSFNDLKTELTENDIDQIIGILGRRCREKTKNRLRSILTYSPSMVDSVGILERLIKEEGKWFYIAGQSYPEEIRIVRECILNF